MPSLSMMRRRSTFFQHLETPSTKSSVRTRSRLEVIPLDAAVLGSAAKMEIAYGLSGRDAIVLASVLAHLHTTVPAESCFVNRNTKDFDDPDIRERLEALHCKFFPKFAPALAYILTRLKLDRE